MVIAERPADSVHAAHVAGTELNHLAQELSESYGPDHSADPVIAGLDVRAHVLLTWDRVTELAYRGYAAAWPRPMDRVQWKMRCCR